LETLKAKISLLKENEKDGKETRRKKKLQTEIRIIEAYLEHPKAICELNIRYLI
jgi:hypothetical protein